MKPSEVYDAPFLRESYDLWSVHEFFSRENIDCSNKGLETQNQVLVKTHFHPYIDGNRHAGLFSVWFQGFPVMICKTGGRPDYEYYDHFVTNLDCYTRMIQYLQSLMVSDKTYEGQKIYDLEQDVEELNRIYCFNITVKDLGPIPDARRGFERWLLEWSSESAWPYPISFADGKPTLKQKQEMRWKRIQEEVSILLETDPASKDIANLISNSVEGDDEVIEKAASLLKGLSAC